MHKMENIRTLLCVLSHCARFRLFEALWSIALQAPLSIGFSRQEYWSVWLCPSPGDLPDPGMELMSLMSLALKAGSYPLAPPEKALRLYYKRKTSKIEYRSRP